MVDIEHEKVSEVPAKARTMPASKATSNKIKAAHQLLGACREARMQFLDEQDHTACVITDMLVLELQRMIAGNE